MLLNNVITLARTATVFGMPIVAAGAKRTSWIQVLLELQRDWIRHDTYDGARAIVEGSRRRIRYWASLCTGMIDPHLFGTHSLRRTKATLIYQNRQLASRATVVGPHQNREHRQVSGH